MTWSTRQTLTQAAALQTGRSADILLALAQLEQDTGIAGDDATELCAEHQACALRLAELHLVIDHLVANLKGGHGIPPTPEPAAPRKAMRGVTHVKQTPAPAAEPAPRVQTGWNARTPDLHKPARATPPTRGGLTRHPKRDPEQMRVAGTLGGAALRRVSAERAQQRTAAGLLNAREAAAHCGFSIAGWYAAVAGARVPAPSADPAHAAHGPTVWPLASLHGVKPAPRNKHARPATTAPRPDGLLNLDQARAATRYSVPGFGLARRQGHVPQPHSYEGRHPLWRPEQLVGITNRRPQRASPAAGEAAPWP